MQYLNSVHLRGIVGTSRVSEVAGKKLLQFSLATNFIHRDASNVAVITTTWHKVVYWTDANDSLLTLRQGDKVYVEGRIDTQRYTGADGEQRMETTVRAHRMCRVESDNLEMESLPAKKSGEVQRGDSIRIISMNDNYGQDSQARAYIGREGVVEHIDSAGQLHGTWGGLAVIPGVDKFEIITK